MDGRTIGGCAAVLAGALLGGCGDGVERAGANGSSAGGTIVLRGLPITSRAIAFDRLTPAITLDGNTVPVTLNGDLWSANFSLEEGERVPLVVSWRYTLPDGTVLDVARSPEQFVDEADPARTLRVAEYDTLLFDEDRDGLSNLAEIDAGDDPLVPSTSAREFVIELDIPALIEGAVPADDLEVELTLDGASVPLVREGARWTARFGIDDALTHRYQVVWSTLVRDTLVTLAASANISFDRGSSDESLRITAYADSPFDLDEDGVSNLAEIDRGRDPLVPDGDLEVFRAAGQGDCRRLHLEDYPAAEQRLPRELVRLGPPSRESRLVAWDGERRAWYATLYVERAGRLTIDHVGGEPAGTRARVFDRRDDLVDPADAVRVLAESPAGEARARVALDVEPGLHCFALAAPAPDEAAPRPALDDTVLQLGFEPR